MKVATAMIAMVLLMISLAGIGFAIWMLIGVPEGMMSTAIGVALAPFAIGTIALTGLGVMFTVERLMAVTEHLDAVNAAERSQLRKEGKV